MVLVERLDLAALGIEREHGTGVEIVTGVIGARPRCRIAGAPVDRLGVLVVGAGHPGGSTTGFPVVSAPGVVAGLALAGDGEGAPQFLAIIGVERHDISPVSYTHLTLPPIY